MSAKRNIRDFQLENGVVKLVPLNREHDLGTKVWFNQHNNPNDWDSVSIEDIEFLELAGSGANGIVLKGRQININRLCAIKFWLPHHKNSKHYNISINQYKEEIMKLGTFSNNRIVSIYDAKETVLGWHPYSIMEWIDGVTLEEWLNENQNESISVRYDLLNKIIEAVQYCHSQGIYHGDLHNKNIMIIGRYSEGYDVKLLDFGTSLFSRKYNPEKTKQRESKFLLYNTLSLIPEEDNYNFLIFNHGKFIAGIDVEDCLPELVATTLYSLSKIIYILQVGSSTNDALSDIAEAVSNAPYLNVAKIINYVVSFIDETNKKDRDMLVRFFIGCLDNYFADRLQDIDDYNMDSDLTMLYILHEYAMDSEYDWISDVHQFVVHKESTEALIYLYRMRNIKKWIENVLSSSDSYGQASSLIELCRAFLYQYARKKAKERKIIEPVMRYFINSKKMETLFDKTIVEFLQNCSDSLYSLNGNSDNGIKFSQDTLHILNMKI